MKETLQEEEAYLGRSAFIPGRHSQFPAKFVSVPIFSESLCCEDLCPLLPVYEKEMVAPTIDPPFVSITYPFDPQWKTAGRVCVS